MSNNSRSHQHKLRFATYLLGACACPAVSAYCDDLDDCASNIACVDLNKDGILDVILMGRGPNLGRMIAMTLPDMQVLWAIHNEIPGFGVNMHFAGDFDKDGVKDLAVGCEVHPVVVKNHEPPVDNAQVAIVSGATGTVLNYRRGKRMAIYLEDPPTNSARWIESASTYNTDVGRRCTLSEYPSGACLSTFVPPKDHNYYLFGWEMCVIAGKEPMIAISSPVSKSTDMSSVQAGAVFIYSMDGTLKKTIQSSAPNILFGWSLADPQCFSGPRNSIVIGSLHNGCAEFGLATGKPVRTINGRGVMDGSASSIGAYCRGNSEIATLLLSACVRWKESFVQGYVEIFSPNDDEPQRILSDSTRGCDAQFCSDHNSDGFREIVVISSLPWTSEKMKTTNVTDALREADILTVLDGKSHSMVRSAPVDYAPRRHTQ